MDVSLGKCYLTRVRNPCGLLNRSSDPSKSQFGLVALPLFSTAHYHRNETIVKIKSFVGIPFILVCALIVSGQRQQSIKPTPKEQARAMAEVVRLRDEYIEATKEYKASLQKLLTLYQDSVLKAEERVNQSQKLFSENLLSKGELERSEKALADFTNAQNQQAILACVEHPFQFPTQLFYLPTRQPAPKD